MKWYADSESLKPRSYEIKHDPLVGFYLYVFENSKCIRDHLQDSLEIAIEAASEDYDVPKDDWRKEEERADRMTQFVLLASDAAFYAEQLGNGSERKFGAAQFPQKQHRAFSREPATHRKF